MRRIVVRGSLLLLVAVACGRSSPPAGPAGTPPPTPATVAEGAELGAADALLARGRVTEAAAAYRRLADAFERSGERRRQCLALLGWAGTELRLGHPSEAEGDLPRIRALAAGDPGLESRAAYLAAITLHRRGRLAEARVEADKALDLALRSGEPRRLSDAYGVLGTIHSLSGRYREALEVNEKRAALERRLDPTSRGYARALNNLGIDYRHLGRYRDARRVYRQAVGLYRAAGDPDGLAMALFNLSNVYLAVGDLERARTLKQESLTVAERVGNTYGLGLLHDDLAEIYLAAGDLDEAGREVAQALAIDRRAGQAYGELGALGLRGRIELARGRADLAYRTLKAALVSGDEEGYGHQQAWVRAGLARAAAALGKGREAVRWASEAVVRARRLGDPEVEIEALEALGVAREAAGDPAAADAYLDGVELLESWRGRLALGDLAAGVAAPHLEVFEGAIRVLLEEGRAGAAFEVAERAHARWLLHLLAARDAADDTGAAATLRRRLRERWAARQGARGELASSLDRRLGALGTELDRVEEHWRSVRGAAGWARFPRPASLAAVQASLLGSGRALLVYFWGVRDVYGWWVTRDRVRAVRLGTVEDLEPRIDFLRSAVEDPASGGAWRGASEKLSALVLDPLLPPAGAGTRGGELLVVSDGPLADLPLEVLFPAGERLPLGATRRIVYGPSSSVLIALAASPPPLGPERALLAVGDPLGAEAAVSASAGLGRAAAGVPSLPSLPYAAVEAREIVGLFGGRRCDLLVGKRATLGRWLALGPGRYRFLHFATHAVVSVLHPEDTRLLLAGGGLDLPAIRHLRLGAELVTLSACETGLGRRVPGEGVVGLAQAFLAAGAHGVLVSLWRVDDRGTAELMRRFYAGLRAGLPPAEALLRVRREALEVGGRASHPSHWAPFVLVGGLRAGAVDRR